MDADDVTRPPVKYDNWVTPSLPPPLQFTKKRSLFSPTRTYKIELPNCSDNKHYDVCVQLNSISIKLKDESNIITLKNATTDLENMLMSILFGLDSLKKSMSLYIHIANDGFKEIEFVKSNMPPAPSCLVPLKIEFVDFEKYTLLYLYFFISNKVPGQYLVLFNDKGGVTKCCVNNNHPYMTPSSPEWDSFIDSYAAFYNIITSSLADTDLYMSSLKSKYPKVVNLAT
jgi:hypothetical protein